jgi:hypothetical protein
MIRSPSSLLDITTTASGPLLSMGLSPIGIAASFAAPEPYERHYRSGRTMARSGLRMMPTFPSPSLKFRTAGFPRYGFKAGISGAAFPVHWFALALRARYVRHVSCSESGSNALMSTSVQAVPRFTPGALAPVRVMLSRSILTYLAPSAPLAGTSRLHRIAAYT